MSSGREQVHSEMEKCGKHLIQLNYRNFMTGVKVFFCNDKINDLILIVLSIKYHVGRGSGWWLGWEGWKVGGWEVGSRKAETRRGATRMGE